jgi:hypothetical protein
LNVARGSQDRHGNEIGIVDQYIPFFDLSSQADQVARSVNWHRIASLEGEALFRRFDSIAIHDLKRRLAQGQASR